MFRIITIALLVTTLCGVHSGMQVQEDSSLNKQHGYHIDVTHAGGGYPAPAQKHGDHSTFVSAIGGLFQWIQAVRETVGLPAMLSTGIPVSKISWFDTLYLVNRHIRTIVVLFISNQAP